MTHRNRQPAGQPTGGQFAEEARAGASVSLDEIPGDTLERSALIYHAQATAQKVAESDDDNHWTRYDDFEEHFPNIDVLAYAPDFYEPAVRAMTEGREEDAFDILTVAERIHARETRRHETGWGAPPLVSPRPRIRPAGFPFAGDIITGDKYDPNRHPTDTARHIMSELREAKRAHHFPPGVGPTVDYNPRTNTLKVTVHLDHEEAVTVIPSEDDPETGEIVQSEYARVVERRARDIAHRYVEYGTFLRDNRNPNERHYPGIKILAVTEPAPNELNPYDRGELFSRHNLKDRP